MRARETEVVQNGMSAVAAMPTRRRAQPGSTVPAAFSENGDEADVEAASVEPPGSEEMATRVI